MGYGGVTLGKQAEPKRTFKAREAVVILAIVILLILMLGPSTPVFHEHFYICTHTGSRRGYRKWFWGKKTRHWRDESRLASFMQKHHPGEFDHKWTWYSAGGVDCFGRDVSVACRNPGPMRLIAGHGVLDGYVDRLADPERKALYDLFVSGDSEAIEAKVREIQGWYDQSKKGTSP